MPRGAWLSVDADHLPLGSLWLGALGTSPQVHLASVSLVYKRPIRTIAGAPLAVDFVAGVQRYAIASSASELALHDREGVRVDAMSLPSTQLCLRAFDDARPLVVAGGVDGRLCMFHAGRADLLFESSPGASHTNAITDVLPVPELDLVVSASLDKSVRLWDATTGAPRRVLSGHTKGVRALAFASDAKLLFSAGRGRMWGCGRSTERSLVMVLMVMRSSAPQASITMCWCGTRT